MARKERIEQMLILNLSPVFLAVENESHNHHVPANSETHFKVTAVSAEFIELPRVARHRLVNNLLNHELGTGLHALSLHLYTTDEWALKKQPVPQSPACKDGYQHK